MLVKHHGITKDTRGCEFHYTMYGVYENDFDFEKKRSFRKYIEKFILVGNFLR